MFVPTLLCAGECSLNNVVVGGVGDQKKVIVADDDMTDSKTVCDLSRLLLGCCEERRGRTQHFFPSLTAIETQTLHK
jgi:hypothetical protein